MPVHDWSRVDAGTFHDFHCGWIVEIRNALNNGVLPPEYYAMAEQIAGRMIPEVLTQHAPGPEDGPESPGTPAGTTAVTLAPPRVRVTATLGPGEYLRKQRTLVIRHASDDRVVALIEIVSPGNKASRHAFRSFLEKAAEALERGYHLLLIDLHPPGPRDPQGLHGALWSELGDDSDRAPADKPLTLGAYAADDVTTAYVEPIAAGDRLPEMPLFLEPGPYVNVPLEATYQAAWRGVPRRWRDVLEPPLL